MDSDANPWGAAAEEFLWSLGVGQDLPQWLKDDRRQEREKGTNQAPRVPPPQPRKGIGPQRHWIGNDGTPKMVMPNENTPIPPPFIKKRPPANYKPPSIMAGNVKDDDLLNMAGGIAASRDPARAPAAPDANKGYPAYAPAAAVAPPMPAAAPVTQAPSKAGGRFNKTIQQWLAGLDESGILLCYEEGIKTQFDSVDQIVNIYVQAGQFDKQFFEDAGVKKLGHKRLFEKWFKDNAA